MRNPKKGTETTKAQTGRKRTRQGDAKTIVRPTQPIPLEAWKHAADGPGVAYAYNWDGVMKTVERLAVTESKDYTYVHLAEGDGKLDHWVESEKLSNDRLTSDTPTRSTSSSSRSRQVRRVDHIVFGDMIIPAWYSSPYPAALNADLMANGGRLFVCDVCLKYTTSAAQMTRHRGELGNCLGNGPLRGIHHPPGSQIYAHNGWSLWDVDGGAAQEPHLEEEFMMWEHSSIVGHAPPAGSLAILEHAGRLRFCNNLCLLTRLFLDTKLNRYGTNPFRFFVLTEEKNGRHMVRGMFSREKGHHKNNLSCIVVLPPWQRSGWGKRLIHISYLLSRIEGGSGMPEKPLSALGKRVYEAYHKGQVLDYLTTRLTLFGHRESSKIVSDIVAATSIDREDITQTLRKLGYMSTNANDIDWTAVDPRLGTSFARPELQLDQSALFHLHGIEPGTQQITEI